ncbi:bifunctional phosphoribosylaminoimidazolecarboxamide formyltransferase/IMP cyclohydrolase [Gudongella sp. DL1XJH-153]|uniref:bifunctional phosphoribosylaminoimidazolecarboxamide formyltransferase/IMP cyclohydrolase n=1 Tax=Gudongella sp. DL1XJH-153 TaxID=3409804 RepID=UPI003BB62968
MKRALISVYDKTGIIEFVENLVQMDWEIISTGGTYRLLSENGIKVKEVDEITKFPEILDGRVKTLNPRIHGGILFQRDNEEHRRVIEELGIFPIHMVVNNLYPFEETVKKDGVTLEDAIENIDIGGPSMIRAAAKNFQDVTVVIDPVDYNQVLLELKQNGDTKPETRLELARKVFNYTAYYDALIANYFNDLCQETFPQYLTLPYKKRDQLRYGENPHQKAAFYSDYNQTEGTISGAKQLHGKELSFNNINDSNGAISIIKEFQEPAAIAVKHGNPCGAGIGNDIVEAFEKAYESDTESIFGGIIALNREVTLKLAERLSKIFLEIIIAPSFSEEALELLKEKKNIRLLQISEIMDTHYTKPMAKQVEGGMLYQERNKELLQNDMEIVTERFPEEDELDDMVFAWKIAKHISSNGVVIVKNGATLGIGLGEVNRFWAVQKAVERAGVEAKGAVLASDGFFPFKDSIEALAKAGIEAVIQPGGSVRDSEVVKEADMNQMSMVFTGMRHFRH